MKSTEHKEQCAFVSLPWPPSQLSPNARTHWAAKAKIAGSYKRKCWLAAKSAMARGDLFLPDADKILLALIFFPPDKRKRDDDNLIAAFKSGRDGLALALGIDDSRFVTRFRIADATTPGGDVLAELMEYTE